MELKSKFNCTTDLLQEQSFTNHKYGPASYHIGHKYLRASSWSKIPVIYHLAYEYGHLYDWILYTDTDVTLNPKFLNRSISDMLHDWQHKNTTYFGNDLLPNHSQYVQWGQTNLKQTNMITLTNYPWRDDMPCAAIFMIRPNKLGLIQLQDWWNYNTPLKNMYDFMEQDALWYIKEADSDDKMQATATATDAYNHNGNQGYTINANGIINNANLRDRQKQFMTREQIEQMQSTIWNFSINSTTMSLVYEQQMISYTHGSNELHFVHMPNYERTKLAYMATFLRFTNRKLHMEKHFNVAMQNIIDYHHLELNVLGLVEQMELHRINTNSRYFDHNDVQKLKKSQYPFIHRGRPDEMWHLATSTSILTEEKRMNLTENVGKIYNDYIIQFSGDNTLYLVKNNTRHIIPNFDTFLAMGFDLDEILVFRDHGHMKPCREREIPLGANILTFEKQTQYNIYELKPDDLEEKL